MLDAVMMEKPLFYGKINDIIVFDKMLKFFVVQMQKITIKDDS